MTWADKYPEQQLVTYDRSWSTSYSEFEAHLTAHLGQRWECEHIGSTSVPGLLAKPVIDIAIGMPDGVSILKATPLLVDAGWSPPVQVGDHWTTVFPSDGVRSAVGHVFTAGQWPEAHVRLFADWLRRHTWARDRYASLKLDLLAHGVWSNEYTLAKGPFVLRSVNQARAELGLPPATGPL